MTSGFRHHPFQFQADGDKKQVVSSRALMGTFLKMERGKKELKLHLHIHFQLFDASFFNLE